MSGFCWTGLVWLTTALCADGGAAQTEFPSGQNLGAERRTADLPGSWLVLYNLDLPESVEWAEWYQSQRSIPDYNMSGLHASTSEHLNSLNEVQTQLVTPVRTLLDSDKGFRDEIMGILLGYGLPGHYASPPLGGPGGYSVADAFQDMYDDELPPASQQGYNLQCPHFSQSILPPGGRLTRETLAPGKYIVARIDAPSLELAKAMTLRAKAIENPGHYISHEFAWYDYTDMQFTQGIWPWLRDAVSSPFLSAVPWREFDSDFEGTFLDAFRIDAHDVTNWNNGRLATNLPGSRMFAYNFNSWGATTVRSTTDGGGRFVPNAIAEGYAAAIGATGEPQFQAPFPKILVACLAEGWTLGESFYLANPLNDWMWTLVGDPFLRVPNWFDVEPPSPTGSGDIDGDGDVDGGDIILMSQILIGAITTPAMMAAADLSGDGVVNDDDAFLILGPAIWNSPVPWGLHGTGDVNSDGVFDGADIQRFVRILVDSGQGAWPLREVWAGDMNRDGRISVDDIPEFVILATTIDSVCLPPTDPDPDPEP